METVRGWGNENTKPCCIRVDSFSVIVSYDLFSFYFQLSREREKVQVSLVWYVLLCICYGCWCCCWSGSCCCSRFSLILLLPLFDHCYLYKCEIEYFVCVSLAPKKIEFPVWIRIFLFFFLFLQLTHNFNVSFFLLFCVLFAEYSNIQQILLLWPKLAHFHMESLFIDSTMPSSQASISRSYYLTFFFPSPRQ